MGHYETFPFLDWVLHKYGRSYGDRRDTHRRPDSVNNESYSQQNQNRDMVYCFRYQPSGKKLGPQLVRWPPSLRQLSACTDGPFTNCPPQVKEQKARTLNRRFISEVSGIHVG